MDKRFCSYHFRFFRQSLIFIIIFVLVSSTSYGSNGSDTLRDHVSQPGNIPDFHDYHTPTIVPGSTGKLKFTITNRYNYSEDSSDSMSNVSLIVDIYRFSTLEEIKDIGSISHSPKIIEGKSNESTITITNNQLTIEFRWPEINKDESIPVEVNLKSSSESPQGRYFIRKHLNFLFNGRYFDMKSRGYFTDSQWERASENITDQEGQYNVTGPDGENITKYVEGKLDLNILGVDGIIPDTSIRVLEPIPIWPLYVLIGFAVFFAILAVVFYYMDEKGKFPGTKKKLDELGDKVKNFRYRRE